LAKKSGRQKIQVGKNSSRQKFRFVKNQGGKKSGRQRIGSAENRVGKNSGW
jgi:hypothetical protein